jgi:hypothetical protein
MWEQPPPPQKKLHQKKKIQLLGNPFLHSKTSPKSRKLQPNESLGEDFGILFKGRTEVKINDHVTYYISDEMYVYLKVFGLLPLYWISTKYQCSLIFTPYDS